MAKIIDINKHGIRREIDHQYKKGKKNGKEKDQSRKGNEGIQRGKASFRQIKEDSKK